MKIEFDPVLVERTVMQAVYGNRKQEAELHRSLEPFYRMPPGRPREEGFRRVFAEWCARLRFGEALDGLLDERPLVAQRISHCLIREAAGSRSESAELFARTAGAEGRAEDRALVVQVTPRSLAEPERWIPFMRRELFHVADMLDPRFAYERSEIEGLPAQQNLVRDRYRVLWDLYIEHRLAAEGKGDEAAAGRLAKMFARAFGCKDEKAIPEIMRRFATGGALTHVELLAWAHCPELLFKAPDAVHPRNSGDPGTACPLCSFPTFDWYSFNDLGKKERLVEYLGASRPGWSLSEGLCRQCAEMILANAETTEGAKS